MYSCIALYSTVYAVYGYNRVARGASAVQGYTSRFLLYKSLYNALAVYLYRRDNVHAGACQRSGCRPPMKAPAPCWRFSAPHGSAMHLLSPAGGGRGLNNCEEALTLASVLGWSALVSHRRCRCGTVDRLDAASHRTDKGERKSASSDGHNAAYACSLVDGETMGLHELFAGLQLQHLDS